MVDAFQGIYLIRVDVDAWEDALETSEYHVEVIPIFFILNENGQQTGEVIDGGAWGENIPENMAPPLKDFFNP